MAEVLDVTEKSRFRREGCIACNAPELDPSSVFKVRDNVDVYKYLYIG